MRFEHLADVHARRHAERIQADFDRRTVRQERHVFLRHDLGDHALVTVTAGHLVTDFELLLRRDVNLDLLDRAGAGVFAGFDAGDLALTVAFELVELRLVRTDDLHDLDANRRRIDLDVLGDGGEFAEERLGDLAVGRDDDFTGLAIDDVERNFFAEEDVGQAPR